MYLYLCFNGAELFDNLFYHNSKKVAILPYSANECTLNVSLRVLQ